MNLSAATWRLLVDARGDGAWNMAVDEALLGSAAAESAAVLRFYQWAEPTLSLGYFQAYADRDRHAPSAGCPVVRRSSGGGAILHDLELTYSIALPAGHPLARQAGLLYDAVHRSLIAALANWRITASLYTGSRKTLPRSEPFLCFERRATGDVLAGGTKICGSAQRRQRGAVLQHGSVLLASSMAAPELPGIAESTGVQIGAAELAESLTVELQTGLGATFSASQLSAAELAAAHFWLVKMCAPEWIKKR